MHDPDHGHVFHGDEHPAHKDQALEAGIARFATMDVHLADKSTLLELDRRSARNEVEQIGEHRDVEHTPARTNATPMAFSVCPTIAGAVLREGRHARVAGEGVWT
jgi:hypothetical protein